MPNIKKIVVSGSAVSQLANDAGYLIGAGGILSSSAQIASNISGAFTATSGGFSTRITTNETNIATNTTNIGTNTTNIGTLTSATSSYALKTDISGAFTSTSSSIATTAASIASRVTTIEGTGTIQGVGTTNNVTFANVTATGNVSITGTLFVDGTTTTINSTNLNIEDKFILLNSGSTGGSPTEGGIVVQSGSQGFGNAFYYDSTDGRWSLKRGADSTTGGFTPEAFMSSVILGTAASVQTSGSYFLPGNIIIDGGDIYIIDNAAPVA